MHDQFKWNLASQLHIIQLLGLNPLPISALVDLISCEVIRFWARNRAMKQQFSFSGLLLYRKLEAPSSQSGSKTFVDVSSLILAGDQLSGFAYCY